MLRRYLPFNVWSLYWAGAGLIAGGILHILLILTLPDSASGSAWKRLETSLPVNALQVIPPVRPGASPLPLLAPDVRYAFCRLDLGDGPVRVVTSLPGGAWSIALYTRDGLNHYTITGLDLRRSDLTMIVTRARGNNAVTLPPTEGATGSTVTVAAPEREGLLVLRAPMVSPADESQIDRIFAGTRCAPSAAQDVG